MATEIQSPSFHELMIEIADDEAAIIELNGYQSWLHSEVKNFRRRCRRATGLEQTLRELEEEHSKQNPSPERIRELEERCRKQQATVRERVRRYCEMQYSDIASRFKKDDLEA